MKLVLDCNIWISFLIGHKAKMMERILMHPQTEIFVCSALIDEIKDVARRPKIQKYVGKDDVNDLLDIIEAYCTIGNISKEAVSPLRDPDDLYLLSLAESVGADFLVSGDKDLTDLQAHGKTKIINLSDLIAIIGD